jgi:RNA polymerase-binding transcription factor DksA
MTTRPYGNHSATGIFASAEEAGTSDEQWLQDTCNWLRQELDDLYDTTARDDVHARQRIARILRAFHLMEAGEYGVCTCCGVRIRKSRLEADPTCDTCETCG